MACGRSSSPPRCWPWLRQQSPAIFILVWATVLFWPTLFSDRALFWHDASIQNIPLRKCLRDAVAAGAFPVWSWTYGGGYPVGCDVQSGLFYPLQAFDLTGIVTPERGFAISAWLHFVLAGLGMWVFLAGHGIGVAGRLIAALGYMGSGFLAGHVMHVHLVWQAAWLPWLLVGLDWLWRKPSWPRAAVAGMPLGLTLLAGQPQIAFYVFCACVLWTLLGPLPSASRRVQALGWTVAAAGFGLWLGAGPYWAGRDLFAGSMRAARGTGPGGVFHMALDPRYWPLILHPFLYGSYAENDYFGGAHHYEVCGYLAAPVLVLGFLGLVSARAEHRRFALALAVLAVVAFFMAAARQNPLYYFFGRWPPLGSFRAHARWVLLLGMSWSALAG
ncbi:MAG: YfhO family protein, partial [Armatimonadetes bacterium]|nr:YfhO family protein [Armatimonadota bacterium]